MERRSFLTSALKGSVAAAAATVTSAGALAQTTDAKHSAKELWPVLPEALVGPSAMEGYFSEERMMHALQISGVSQIQKPKDVLSIAYNFPSWHASPWMEARFGKGWTGNHVLLPDRYWGYSYLEALKRGLRD